MEIESGEKTEKIISPDRIKFWAASTAALLLGGLFVGGLIMRGKVDDYRGKIQAKVEECLASKASETETSLYGLLMKEGFPPKCLPIHIPSLLSTPLYPGAKNMPGNFSTPAAVDWFEGDIVLNDPNLPDHIADDFQNFLIGNLPLETLRNANPNIAQRGNPIYTVPSTFSPNQYFPLDMSKDQRTAVFRTLGPRIAAKLRERGWDLGGIRSEVEKLLGPDNDDGLGTIITLFVLNPASPISPFNLDESN